MPPTRGRKGPFLIGFQEHYVDGLLTQDAVMHVDLDHPRVTSGAGEPVFLPQGGNTPYLDHIAGVLRGIHEGSAFAASMFTMLDDCGLIQPVTLDAARAASPRGRERIARHRPRATGGAGVHAWRR